MSPSEETVELIARLGAIVESTRNQLHTVAAIAQRSQERSEALARILEENGIEDTTRPAPQATAPLSTNIPPAEA